MTAEFEGRARESEAWWGVLDQTADKNKTNKKTVRSMARPEDSQSRCNRVHLHIVFVLLYSVCRSVNVLPCVDVIQSFTYVLRVIILDVIKDDGERARESEMQYQRPLAFYIYIPSPPPLHPPKKKARKKEEENRNFSLWLVCCCLLPACYFHRPFTQTRGAASRIFVTLVQR